MRLINKDVISSHKSLTSPLAGCKITAVELDQRDILKMLQMRNEDRQIWLERIYMRFGKV
jgi:hypothetical protein